MKNYSMWSEQNFDCCVLCGGETNYTETVPIAQRAGYIEGAGQLCLKCSRQLQAEGLVYHG